MVWLDVWVQDLVVVKPTQMLSFFQFDIVELHVEYIYYDQLSVHNNNSSSELIYFL